MELGIFLFFATVTIIAALMVVIARNPVHSALALMVCLVQVAALFVLLGSPFLAALQIFVYVGAVMVLVLFVIMMLDVREAARVRFLQGALIPGLVTLALLGAQMLLLLISSDRLSFVSTNQAPILKGGGLEQLSKTMFTDYLLPFEVISVILLVALVGAIVLTRSEVK